MAKNRGALAGAAAAVAAVAAAEAVAETAPNRFEAHFPVANVIFTPSVQNPGKPWTDGTIARTLALATLEMGDTGMYVPNCRIQHLRLPGGIQRFELMMPTTPRAGGKIHIPVFDPGKGTEVDAEWSEQKTAIVNRWLKERKAAVAAGAPSIAASVRNSGITVNDDMLAEFGITNPTPPAPPVAANPPAASTPPTA